MTILSALLAFFKAIGAVLGLIERRDLMKAGKDELRADAYREALEQWERANAAEALADPRHPDHDELRAATTRHGPGAGPADRADG